MRNFEENPLTYDEVLKIKKHLALKGEGHIEKEYGWASCLLELELPWDYYIKKKKREDKL